MKWALLTVGGIIGALVHAFVRSSREVPVEPIDLEKLEATRLARVPETIYPPGRADLLELVDQRVSIAGEPDEVYQSRPENPDLYYIHVPSFTGSRGYVSESWWAVPAQGLLA